MSNNILVIAKSKAKETTMKCVSRACGKEVIEKDKVGCLTTFAPHDLIAKIEWIEDLEGFFGTSNARSRSHEDEQL